MNFSFSTPHSGDCLVKLRASGRYGFSLPKTVEITAPDGLTSTYVYHSRKVGLSAELTNRALVRIAIGQFLQAAALDEHDRKHAREIEIDDTVLPFSGSLAQIRPFAPPPPPPRVRPARFQPKAAAGTASVEETA